MANVSFTPNLERHVESSSLYAAGATVREVLDNCFVNRPALRGYLLDDQGRLRRNVVVFVDTVVVVDRAGLTDGVRSDSDIFVMQALAGG